MGRHGKGGQDEDDGIAEQVEHGAGSSLGVGQGAATGTAAAPLGRQWAEKRL